MRMRWRLVLPILGLIPFVLLSYQSIRRNDELHHGHASRYFWWGAARLDSDPLNKRPVAPVRCEHGIEDCTPIDLEYIWIAPGWMERTISLSALPAFLASLGVVQGLAHFGVSEVVSFMAFTPVFMVAWFYFVGWILDRRGRKAALSQ